MKCDLKFLNSNFYGNDNGSELDALTNKVMQKFNSYSISLDGKIVQKSDLVKALKSEKSSETREKLYNASISVGDYIANDVINLVKERNKVAQSNGYNNYYEMCLEREYGINVKDVDNLINTIYTKTHSEHKIFTDKKKKALSEVFNLSPKDIQTYHYEYKLKDDKKGREFKSTEEIINTVKNAYKNMGYDIDNMNISLDLYPRKGKYANAACYYSVPGEESKVLANLNNDSESLKILMHELGHAIYNCNIGKKLPYYQKRPESTLSEAIAMTLENIGDVELAYKNSETKRQDIENEIFCNDADYIPYLMQIIEFEKLLYQNPEQDLKQLWKDLSIKFTNANENIQATNKWATITHYIVAPGSCQIYLKGKVIQAQLFDAMCKKFGTVTNNSNVANFLNKKIFEYGLSKSVEDIVKDSTEKTIAAEVLCERMNNAFAYSVNKT